MWSVGSLWSRRLSCQRCKTWNTHFVLSFLRNVLWNLLSNSSRYFISLLHVNSLSLISNHNVYLLWLWLTSLSGLKKILNESTNVPSRTRIIKEVKKVCSTLEEKATIACKHLLSKSAASDPIRERWQGLGQQYLFMFYIENLNTLKKIDL